MRWHAGRFTLVMATGITSAAMRAVGLAPLAGVLLVIAAASFAALAVLLVGQCWRRPSLAVGRSSPGAAFGAFAFTGACAVLGRVVLGRHGRRVHQRARGGGGARRQQRRRRRPHRHPGRCDRAPAPLQAGAWLVIFPLGMYVTGSALAGGRSLQDHQGPVAHDDGAAGLAHGLGRQV